MTGSKIVKSRTPYFVGVVSVLLPICYIGWCIPYLHFFSKEVVTLLCAITDRWA